MQESKYNKGAFAVLGLILICILTVMLFRVLNNAPANITFNSFLDYISNVPDIKFVNISDFSIVGDWGFFDFLRDFLNLFTKFIGFSIWFGQNVTNLIIWLFYIVSYIFIV